MDSMTAQSLLCDSMEEKALELGIKGVGIAFVVDPEDDSSELCPTIVIVAAFHRGPKQNVTNDIGANYMAVALAKFSQMLRVWDNSGVAPVKGEFNYKGGVIAEIGGRKTFVAFSGGTEAQDLEIANHAISCLSDDVVFRPWDESPVCLTFVIYTH